jgi:hypothetical protein
LPRKFFFLPVGFCAVSSLEGVSLIRVSGLVS